MTSPTATTPPRAMPAGGRDPDRAGRSRRVVRDRALQTRVAAAALSGLALAVAFPPWDLGPLGLVALVPLLWTWRDASPGRAGLYGFVFGIVFFGVLLSWTWYFGVVAYFPLVLAGGAYIAAPGAVVGGLYRLGVRSPWLTAAAWVLFEQLRGRFPFGGLPWGETGAALHDLPTARSLAGVGGVALVSFLVVACNGLLVELALAARRHLSRPAVGAAAGLALAIGLAPAAHALRGTPSATGRIRFALIQGNDQNRDIEDPLEFERVVVQSHFDLAGTLRGSFDLIVFPESALNRNPETDPGLRRRLVDIAAAHDSAVLANALTPGPEGRDFNTNLLYEPDGDLQGTYSKQHLVPFGEYVPLRDELSFLGALDQIPYDYEPGGGRRLFRVDGHAVGTIICFESAFGPLVRDFVHDGAELLVVTTNNRSYRRSGNAAQHLALSQMRAAETGRPVLHASISGISGVVDADGDVHDATDLFVNEIVSGEVTTTSGQTPYVRYGDWVIWASGAALVVAAACARFSRWPDRRRAGPRP